MASRGMERSAAACKRGEAEMHAAGTFDGDAPRSGEIGLEEEQERRRDGRRSPWTVYQRQYQESRGAARYAAALACNVTM